MTDAELEVVLAHERAHLDGRHHLVRQVAVVAHDALGGRLGTRGAKGAIAWLVELHADDAVPPARRVYFTGALLALAGHGSTKDTGGRDGGAPEGLSALGDTEALASRVDRMALPRTPLSRVHSVGVGATVVAMLGVPFVVAASPTMAVDLAHVCHTSAGHPSRDAPAVSDRDHRPRARPGHVATSLARLTDEALS
ncbi:hypothetical protein KLP28_08015 [Nocardioidaceae bacterium]|nr:hypothetical protein KLP28_08015 [Nocardioidaceae bacterium]